MNTYLYRAVNKHPLEILHEWGGEPETVPAGSQVFGRQSGYLSRSSAVDAGKASGVPFEVIRSEPVVFPSRRERITPDSGQPEHQASHGAVSGRVELVSHVLDAADEADHFVPEGVDLASEVARLSLRVSIISKALTGLLKPAGVLTHDDFPSVGVSAAATAGDVVTTVGEAPGVLPSATPGAPSEGVS